MKRYFPVLAAILAALSLLTAGCEKSEGENDTVLVVAGESIDQKEFEYQLVSMMTAYEYYSGTPINWTLPIDGLTAEEFFKDQAADSVILYRAVKVKGEELDLALNDDELNRINQSVLDMIDQAGGEKAFDQQLAEQGLDRELYTFVITGPEAYYKIFQSLYGEGGSLAPTDASVREYFHEAYMHTRHIMFYLTDENGLPLDEETKQERRALMEEVYERLRSGEDFAALMEAYNEDVGINDASLCFSYGEMPENYYQAAISLEPEEYSEILEADGTLCVINRLPLDEAFLEQNYDSIRDEYATEAFNDLLEEWKSELTIEKKPLYYEISAKTVYEASK